MVIKVLGSGCTNCKTLEKRALEAVVSVHVTATVEKVTDIKQIIQRGLIRAR